uniref:Uncharacterized protein n=1 Tax=Lepeophtheirus salmonis TaxID=72036 RepID=A0A0K2UUH6_LEPSM
MYLTTKYRALLSPVVVFVSRSEGYQSVRMISTFSMTTSANTSLISEMFMLNFTRDFILIYFSEFQGLPDTDVIVGSAVLSAATKSFFNTVGLEHYKQYVDEVFILLHPIITRKDRVQ